MWKKCDGAGVTKKQECEKFHIPEEEENHSGQTASMVRLRTGDTSSSALRSPPCTMLTLLCLCLLLGSSVASSVQSRMSSFVGEHGAGGGTAFSFSAEQLNGSITGLRVRENPSHIIGVQFQYGGTWGPYYGNPSGTLYEILLHKGENIVQVSGKVASNVNELIFITNRGRILKFGQPSGNSFNDFPLYDGTVLRYVSGRYSSVIHSIGFHWGVSPSCVNCKEESK
ncbi:zymogen granule membrane protein 16-like isoform X1 [Bufo bufo]|uniref:zymogen granule membrane protein 16-like isoform X1 n=1 Tax=Bufo bufo TaxID=8384 RepID=UPI001ABE1E35|nr:zymogen granule membrane protein 16-like isoform X1 [Bufo bufo]